MRGSFRSIHELKVGIQADSALAEEVFRSIDKDGSGKISWDELWAAAKPSVDEVLQVLRGIQEQRGLGLQKLLQKYDSSGDGTLAFREFQALLQSLSIDIDGETAVEVFKRLDSDGDKQLSLRAMAGDSNGGACAVAKPLLAHVGSSLWVMPSSMPTLTNVYQCIPTYTNVFCPCD